MRISKSPTSRATATACGANRLRSGDRDQRVSLGTKDPLAAHMMAAKIKEAWRPPQPWEATGG